MSELAGDPEGLRLALDMLLQHMQGPGVLPPPATRSPLPAELPEAGLGPREALLALAPWVLDGAAPLRHPGYVAHMDPPTPWVTWATAQWSAALNQNLLHPDTAPVGRELERQVTAWLAAAFGMDGGHLVPGSTVANLTALWAARELRGVDEVVASEAAHLSLAKAAHLLGLRYRAVPCDTEQRMRTDMLGDLSSSALVLTAGTVAAGAVDALGGHHGAAWMHVDAAWAGPLRLSPEHAWLLDGIEAADSVSVSAHKWLWQPKESAAVLFADSERAHGALASGGAYLAAPNIGLLGSHGQAALPLAATLLAWGREGVAARIERCMDLSESLADLVAADERLHLRARPTTGVILWRPRTSAAAAVRERMSDAFGSLAEVDGQTWLRSVCVHPYADVERVVAAALEALHA